MSKLETKLINFENALQRLKEADKELNKQGVSDVVRAGNCRKNFWTLYNRIRITSKRIAKVVIQTIKQREMPKAFL